MKSLVKSIGTGLFAGCAATAPMTLSMVLIRRLLPRQDRYNLPPYQITMRVADEVDIASAMGKAERIGTTWLGHFGYGAAMGGLYAALAEKIPAPPLVKGVCYGLLVWAVGYVGWLPAFGILNMPKEQSARRNALMIGAHMIWGAVLGMTHRKLDE